MELYFKVQSKKTKVKVVQVIFARLLRALDSLESQDQIELQRKIFNEVKNK